MPDAEQNPKDHDEFLVRGLRENDAVVLKSFSDRYLMPMVSFVMKMGVPRDDAEEIACVAMTKIGTDIEKYDPKQGKFSTWIFGISKNLAIDYFRRRKRQQKDGPAFQSLESVFHLAKDEVPAPATSTNPNLKALFARTFAALSEPDREVLCLAVQGWSYAEIGEALGKSANNVKVQAHRARARLREALKESAEQESIDISDADWDGLKHWNGEKEVEL